MIFRPYCNGLTPLPFRNANAFSRIMMLWINKLVEVSLLQDLAALAGPSPNVPEGLEKGEQCRATA